jgi:hypothetical protein
MELSNAYITTDDLREHLDDKDQRLPSNLLIRVINAASRAIDQYTGAQFYTDDTPTPRLFTTAVDNELIVDPFGSLLGLVVATDDAGGRTYTGNWPVTDFLPSPLNGPTYTRLVRDSGGSRRFPTKAPVQVTARWGYAVCPPEVELATLLKSASLFTRKDSPMGVAAFGDFGPIRVTRRDPDVVDLLQPYVLDVAMVG